MYFEAALTHDAGFRRHLASRRGRHSWRCVVAPRNNAGSSSNWMKKDAGQLTTARPASRIMHIGMEWFKNTAKIT